MEDNIQRVKTTLASFALCMLLIMLGGMHLAYEKGKAAVPCGKELQHNTPGQIYIQPDLERNI